MIFNLFCHLDCVRWNNTQTKLATRLQPRSWLYLNILARVGADLTRLTTDGTHYLRIDSTIFPEHGEEKRENLGTRGGFATWIRLSNIWFQMEALHIRVFFFAHCHESCVTQRDAKDICSSAMGLKKLSLTKRWKNSSIVCYIPSWSTIRVRYHHF